MRGLQRVTVLSYEFRSCQSALALPPPTLQRVIEDCQCVFGKGGGSEKTWWVACDGKARCALEQLALAVFKARASGGWGWGCSRCRAFDPRAGARARDV